MLMTSQENSGFSADFRLYHRIQDRHWLKLSKKGTQNILFCVPYELSFLAEIWQSQTGGRLVFTLFLHGYYYQHDNRDDVGEHFEEFLRRAREARDVVEKPEEYAEKIRTPYGLKRFPACENDERDSEPAEIFDAGVICPGALNIVHDIIKTAQTCYRSANTSAEVFVLDNANSAGVCGGGVFAHRAKIEALACFAEEPT